MNLLIAMVLATVTVYLLAHILALASKVLDQEFMLQYERDFWRMEQRRNDRRLFLDNLNKTLKKSNYLKLTF